MRKVLTASFCLAATIGLFSLPAQAKELVYGAWVSPKHGAMRYALPILMDGVKKDTNGALEWRLVAGGQLADGRGTLGAIREGLMDAGMVLPSYTPNELPATGVVFNTLVFGDETVAVAGASNEVTMLHCPECQANYKKNNMVFLGGYAASPFMMMCRKSVKGLGDLKGARIRTSGGGVALVERAGGVPVSMSPAEATTALQRGALDCVLGAPAWLRSYGYQDVVKTILNFPLGVVGPVMLMSLSRAAWDDMTPVQKKAHLEYAPHVVAASVIKGYIEEDEKIVATAADKGVDIVDVGPEFEKMAQAHFEDQRQTIINDATKLGVNDAAKIMSEYEKALDKWKRLSKEIGRDPDKYAAALKREIYDKLDPDQM